MYHFGEVLLIEYPFSDLAGIKQRPAVVLKDTNDFDVIFARITGQIRASAFDIEIKDWQLAGLLKPSIIRIHKLATLETSLIKRSLGKLSIYDAKNLQMNLMQLFNIKI